MTCSIGMQGGYSFFLTLCLNNHTTGTDQYFMHLTYLGNTHVVSAQISKIHSHLGSSACCQLLSIELFHDRATLVPVRLMSPDLTCSVLHISWAGSCVPMLHSIVVRSHGFSTVMRRKDHWCCIILAPLML